MLNSTNFTDKALININNKFYNSSNKITINSSAKTIPIPPKGYGRMVVLGNVKGTSPNNSQSTSPTNINEIEKQSVSPINAWGIVKQQKQQEETKKIWADTNVDEEMDYSQPLTFDSARRNSTTTNSKLVRQEILEVNRESISKTEISSSQIIQQSVQEQFQKSSSNYIPPQKRGKIFTNSKKMEEELKFREQKFIKSDEKKILKKEEEVMKHDEQKKIEILKREDIFKKQEFIKNEQIEYFLKEKEIFMKKQQEFQKEIEEFQKEKENFQIEKEKFQKEKEEFQIEKKNLQKMQEDLMKERENLEKEIKEILMKQTEKKEENNSLLKKENINENIDNNEIKLSIIETTYKQPQLEQKVQIKESSQRNKSLMNQRKSQSEEFLTGKKNYKNLNITKKYVVKKDQEIKQEDKIHFSVSEISKEDTTLSSLPEKEENKLILDSEKKTIIKEQIKNKPVKEEQKIKKEYIFQEKQHDKNGELYHLQLNSPEPKKVRQQFDKFQKTENRNLYRKSFTSKNYYSNNKSFRTQSEFSQTFRPTNRKSFLNSNSPPHIHLSKTQMEKEIEKNKNFK